MVSLGRLSRPNSQPIAPTPALLVVRPYGDWIRAHVFAILDEAGIATSPTVVISEDADDLEVVRVVRARRPGALLVPFHAKRDHNERDGFRSGVSALVALQQRMPPQDIDVPIVMPVSEFGLLGFKGILQRQQQAFRTWFEQHVCVLVGPFGDHGPHVASIQAYLAQRP